MEFIKYQQGDVVMFKVDDDFFNKNIRSSNSNHASYKGNQPTHAIIAFGEVTGHKHQINMEDMLEEAGVRLNMGYNREAGVHVPEGFQVTGKAVTLTHEEHNPIELPPGNYVVKRVQEMNHITRRTNNVAD